MLHLLRPTLITLSLTGPATSYALGLGDIHIQSALHQPLVAQIELVGVGEDELARVSAKLASDELFQKYNLERAPFIYGTTLTVGRDAQGRPVLNVRSTEKFTEPVVTLLVDLHSPSGELVREYTLLLDPAGLGTNAEVASNAPVGFAPSSTAASDSPAVAGNEHPAPAAAAAGTSSRLLGTTYTVARHDTLARIVTATGARSRTERHRMMVAIYRANPAAFQSNFNRMHAGVTLTFPTPEQLATISTDETNREYDAQMAEWRASLHHGASNSATDGAGVSAASPGTAGSAAAKAAAASIAANNALETTTPNGEALPTDQAALTQRIASLEQSLAQIQQQLKSPLPDQSPAAATSSVPGSLATAAAPNPATARADAPAVEDEATSDNDEEEAPPTRHRGYQLIAIGATTSLLFFAAAWFYLRRRNHAYHMTPRYPIPVTHSTEADAAEDESRDEVESRTPPPPSQQSGSKGSNPAAAQQQPTPKDASWLEDSFSTPIADLLNEPTVSLAIEDTAKLPLETFEPTVRMPKQSPQDTPDTELLVAPELELAGDTVEQKFSFFNPEATTNTEHVVMGSGPSEPKSFVERRKNPVDVLRQAIEREPDRSDLRLKLLELYYTAAAENRRAFLEATRQIAQNASLASSEDWSRIADMGRVIAPDDKLFASDGGREVDGQRVA